MRSPPWPSGRLLAGWLESEPPEVFATGTAATTQVKTLGENFLPCALSLNNLHDPRDGICVLRRAVLAFPQR